MCVPGATPGTDGQLAPVCLGGLSLGLFIIIIVIIIIIITIVIDYMVWYCGYAVDDTKRDAVMTRTIKAK